MPPLHTIERDPQKALYGRAHVRAYPHPKKSIGLLGHHRSTEFEWRKSGSPFLRYFGHAQPWVVEAFLAVIKAQNELKDWSRPQLEGRAAMLEAEIGRAYAETVRLAHTPGSTTGEQNAADFALAELVAERQAVRIELEKQRRRELGH